MTRKANRTLGPSTRAIHLGYDPAEAQGALTQPIYMTSTYAFETAEAGGEMFRGERAGYIYGRTRNPTQSLLEERLASLEGAEAGLATASGIGAISATMWTLLNAGDEVLIDHTLYGSTFAYFMHGLTRFGITVHLADFTKIDEVEAKLIPGIKLVFFETPANPNLRVIDIAAVSERARAVDALVVVDNTFCSPILQRPIERGADLVVHSATKYLGGHGDLLGGAILGPAETVKRIRMNGLRALTGATISPHTAFLILRGLKTLGLRLERHCASARIVAEMLETHRKVAWVGYPGLRSFPQYELARRQMAAPGGLIALELKGGLSAGLSLMNALKLITRAVSLGDAETLIQHPASMTHSTYSREERAAHGISDGLVRLSVGLEDVEDIIADLEEGLAAVPGG